MNRPEVRNAVNGERAAQLGAAVDRLEADPDLRVGFPRRPSASLARSSAPGSTCVLSTVHRG
ncbi:hypothetical protein ACQEVB_30010 [Pseudonocardia sp. CA-107938]|uniref:hypothetical protein n=1 Tax=Pseudonocardia sp. CA-107938 TaxID=3240021 RepID=UPI003D8F7767